MPEQAFLDLLTLSEQIARDSGRLGAYAYLWFSEDTKQLQARSFKNKVEEDLTALQNHLLFFDLWWQGVDEPNAERLMAHSGDFRYHLETIRRFKPHTLSEAEEKIINIKNITGQSAIHQLYDIVTNGFTFTLRVGGRKKTMNREALTAFLRSPNAAMREAAYREMYRVYESHQDLLGELYKTLVSDWKAENLQLRHFASPDGHPKPQQRHPRSSRRRAPLRLHEERPDLSTVLRLEGPALQDQTDEPIPHLCAAPG